MSTPQSPNPSPFGAARQPGPVPGQPPVPATKGMSIGCIIGFTIAAMALPALVITAALAIYGIRRFSAAARTSEAKNTVSAIARAGAASYEREQLKPDGTAYHTLCESTGPDAKGHGAVPLDLDQVRAHKYTPDDTAGRDFGTGSAKGGWLCLKFSLSTPHYYQYHYNKGGNYQTKNPTLPGPDGFEAAAIGDVDGDKVPSYFSRTGALAPGGGISLQTQIFIDSEFE